MNMFYYADALMHGAQYEEASKWFARYLGARQGDPVAHGGERREGDREAPRDRIAGEGHTESTDRSIARKNGRVSTFDRAHVRRSCENAARPEVLPQQLDRTRTAGLDKLPLGFASLVRVHRA